HFLLLPPQRSLLRVRSATDTRGRPDELAGGAGARSIRFVAAVEARGRCRRYWGSPERSRLTRSRDLPSRLPRECRGIWKGLARASRPEAKTRRGIPERTPSPFRTSRQVH